MKIFKLHPALKSYLPATAILCCLFLTYFLGFWEYMSFELLKEHRDEFRMKVAEHPYLSPVIFIAIYISVAALSIPVTMLLAITCGFLFPQPFSTLYSVIGATIGASIVFLAARTALRQFLQNRMKPWLAKMEHGFQKNQANYLFFLRFTPVIPFWITNLAAAFFNVSFKTFLWTTFIGLIPGEFFHTQIGAGLGAIFDSQQKFSFENVLNTQMKIALLVLALISLVSILIKKHFKH